MADEIELIGDDEGVVVMGDSSASKRFLEKAGLLSQAKGVDLGRRSKLLSAEVDTAQTAAEIAEHSALYLALTPESAQRLNGAGSS